jgi:hypothetical protein
MFDSNSFGLYLFPDNEVWFLDLTQKFLLNNCRASACYSISSYSIFFRYLPVKKKH